MTGKFKILSSKNLEILKNILILFIGWRIIITLVAFFGLSFLPNHLSPEGLGWPSPNIDYWLRFANWDGGHFRGIAENGYLHPFQVVFFPLYPVLITLLTYLKIPSVWGGVIISNLSFIAALFFLYKTILIDYKNAVAEKAVLVTLAFPTAFYFGSVYSESLFFFLCIASYYFARKKQWKLAFLFASLSALTRLIGLAVILAIGIEYFSKTIKAPSIKEIMSSFPGRISLLFVSTSFLVYFLLKISSELNQYFLSGIIDLVLIVLCISSLVFVSFYTISFIFKNFNFRNIFTKQTIYFLLSFIPFSLYCFFLYKTQGDFFAFIHQESYWKRFVVTPWSAPLDYFSKLVQNNFFRIGPVAQTLIEFLFFIIFLILLIISYFKMRISYVFFFAVALILPITTGTLQAVHRYGLVIFPALILLALIKDKKLFDLWIMFCIMLQGLLLVLFINGYWVS